MRLSSGGVLDLRGEEADLFLQQIESLYLENRNRLFSKEAQEYLGNLLVEKDRKQKELDNA